MNPVEIENEANRQDSSPVHISPPELLKGNKDRIEERRRHVRELALKNVPFVTIAKILKVSERTVREDISVLRDRGARRLKEVATDRHKFLGEVHESLEVFNYIRKNALFEAQTATSKYAKDRFLNTAMKAEALAAKIKIDAIAFAYGDSGVESMVDRNEPSQEDRSKNHKYAEVLQDPMSRQKVINLFQRFMKIAEREVKQDANNNNGSHQL